MKVRLDYPIAFRATKPSQATAVEYIFFLIKVVKALFVLYKECEEVVLGVHNQVLEIYKNLIQLCEH